MKDQAGRWWRANGPVGLAQDSITKTLHKIIQTDNLKTCLRVLLTEKKKSVQTHSLCYIAEAFYFTINLEVREGSGLSSFSSLGNIRLSSRQLVKPKSFLRHHVKDTSYPSSKTKENTQRLIHYRRNKHFRLVCDYWPVSCLHHQKSWYNSCFPGSFILAVTTGRGL